MFDSKGMTVKNENNANERVYRIGELAREFDITLRTLRFYEDKGLISPRRVGATRLYSRADRARLKIILLGKRVGMSLQDIGEIIDLYNPTDGNRKQIEVSLDKGRAHLKVLHEEREKLERSITELEQTLKNLEDMI